MMTIIELVTGSVPKLTASWGSLKMDGWKDDPFLLGVGPFFRGLQYVSETGSVCKCGMIVRGLWH